MPERPVRPEPHALDRWLPCGWSPQAMCRIEVMFGADGKLHVRRTIPERLVEELKANEKANRELLTKGRLIGHTQRHWLKVGSLPKDKHAELARRFGDPKKDPAARRAWARWWNDPDNRAFRSSEHRA